MIKKKYMENMSADDLIRKQLTMRAVVWDVMNLKKGETDKLERELKIYDICRVRLFMEKEQEDQMAGIGCLEKYDEMQRVLSEAGFAEKEAVLVTEDAMLVEYVHQQQEGIAAHWTDAASQQTGAAHWTDAASQQTDAAVQKEGSVCAEKKKSGCIRASFEEKSAVRGTTYVKYAQEKNSGAAAVYYERKGNMENVSADMIVQGFEEIGVQFLDRIHKRRNGLPWNILYTSRTCVREITLSDLDELYELYEGDGITDYTEPLFVREKEEEYTKSYISYMYRYYGYGMWVVCDRVSGKLLGRAGIEHHDGENGEDEVLMELGYMIRKEYQSKGYATEVCKAILEYACEELQMNQLHCFIHPKNYASIRVAEKLGFLKCDSADGRREVMLHYSIELNSGLK